MIPILQHDFERDPTVPNESDSARTAPLSGDRPHHAVTSSAAGRRPEEVRSTRVDSPHETPQPWEHGLVGSILGVQILGTGSSAPDTVVPNEELASLGFDSDWIVQRTGILQRHRAPEGVCTSEVAYPAAVACLEQAGVSAKELDLIIVATMTPDCPTPSTSCNLQLKLGATCPAMDLNAACSGFMYALAVGAQFVAANPSLKVLVLGVDLMSRTVNPKDHKTFALFGDGAGAVLLGHGSGEQGLLSYFLGAQADGGRFLAQPGGGTCEPITPENYAEGRQYVVMDGRAVFKWAVRMVDLACRRVLEAAELTIDDIDSVIMHQANIRIIEAAANSLKIPREKLFVNVDRYGNTSAGSVPLALDEAVRDNKIRRGDKLLMVGFGAGFTWGACVLQW